MYYQVKYQNHTIQNNVYAIPYSFKLISKNILLYCLYHQDT